MGYKGSWTWVPGVGLHWQREAVYVRSGRAGAAGEDDCSGGSQTRDGVSTRNDRAAGGRAALEEMDAGGEPTLSLR